MYSFRVMGGQNFHHTQTDTQTDRQTGQNYIRDYVSNALGLKMRTATSMSSANISLSTGAVTSAHEVGRHCIDVFDCDYLHLCKAPTESISRRSFVDSLLLLDALVVLQTRIG